MVKNNLGVIGGVHGTASANLSSANEGTRILGGLIQG
jgi:hypothetical protein